MVDRETVRVLILGSTGSIGTQTIEVIEHLNGLYARGAHGRRYEVVGLAAGRNSERLFAQGAALGVQELALANGASGDAAHGANNVRSGSGSAERLVEEVEADLVVASMVGFAGLGATMRAVEKGIDVALANKETLVAAGELVVRAAEQSGARLLPVDSEHSGVWQCLASHGKGLVEPAMRCGDEVARIVLTASGGAMREMAVEALYHATPEQALAHPNWDMGAKVTIDSASLTNKALELIEAHWLFGVGSDRLGALVHPSSTVHSFVEFADGSVVAQLGAPDMRTPIQVALTHPERVAGVSEKMDWSKLGGLEFREVDTGRYPAIGLGYRVIDEGGTSGAVMNAANEAAVEAFLEGRIAFGRIAELTEGAMDALGVHPIGGMGDIVEADARARRWVEEQIIVTGGAGAAVTRAERHDA